MAKAYGGKFGILPVAPNCTISLKNCITKLAKHRMSNNTEEDVEFLEIQIGDYLGEDDIVRVEDDFGRK